MRTSFKCLIGLTLLLAACSPVADQVYMKPVQKVEKVTENPDAVYFDPSVDILFVVDNSGSMMTHQTNLSRNISLFTSNFYKKSILDYHIGVVTTDMGWRAGGYLVGNPKFVTKATPNGDGLLANNLMVGTDGSATEKSFDPVYKALDPLMQQGPNAGFYRPSASLVVIFITDAEDQSDISALDLHQTLLRLKGGVARRVLSYGVIVPSTVTNCERDEFTRPARIETFLSMVFNGSQGKNVHNLCDPAFGDKLADMAKDIVDLIGRKIYLNRVPNIDSIKVTYGNMVLPSDEKTGWVFDPKENAIILGEKIDWASQPIGSRVMVDYTAAQYREDQ